MEENNKILPCHVAKLQLTDAEIDQMRAQDTRLVSDFQAIQLEINAKKHWDLFYKRNESRFFKDRHWTTREFEELLDAGHVGRILLEVGCGVGNLIYPLLEDNIEFGKIYACDLSPRAIEFVKNHKLYNVEKIKAFQTDVTVEGCFVEVDQPVDIITLIFVLSAIQPEKFKRFVKFYLTKYL